MKPENINYARLDWMRNQHHERFKRFVEAKRLRCMDCGGSGLVVIDIIDYWTVYDACGWCEGTGFMTPQDRGWWLTFKRQAKRAKQNASSSTA